MNKKHLVNTFGGKCQICGYCECINALDFHHRDPKQKTISVSKFAGNNKLTYKQIIELENTLLLCCRCHREVHAGIHKEKIDSIPKPELLEEIWG